MAAKKPITVLEFLDDTQPIGVVRVNNVEYKVYKPGDLEEKFYIRYYQAKAEIMDAFDQKTYDNEMAEYYLTEANVIGSVRNMVAANLSMETKELTLKPANLLKLYGAIEKMLNSESDTPESGKPESSEDSEEEPPKEKKTSGKSKSTAKKS